MSKALPAARVVKRACQCASGKQCTRCRQEMAQRAYTQGFADGQKASRESDAKKAPFEREPPHCPTCGCGMLRATHHG